MNYNYVYQKMYIVLFFMIMALIIFSTFHVLIQVLLAASPIVRVLWLKYVYGSNLSFREVVEFIEYPQFILYALIRHNLVDPNHASELAKLVIEKKMLS